MWKGPAFLWCPAHCLHYWLEECGGWGEMELPLSVSVCVCVCVCVRASMCICLSVSHGPVAAGQGQGREQRSDEAAWACRVGRLPRLTNFGPFLGQEWLTKTRTVLQYWRVTGGWGL